MNRFFIKPRPRQQPGTMNKTEKRYADYLEIRKKAGEILDYRFEPMKFRLAANTFLTPDFLVMTPCGDVRAFLVAPISESGPLDDEQTVTFSTRLVERHLGGILTIELHEIKGHWEDDARVKIKVAAEMYPWFVWKAVSEARYGEWKVEEF